MTQQKKRCDECMYSVELHKDKNHVKCIRYASGGIKNNTDWCNDFLGCLNEKNELNMVHKGLKL